MWFIKKDSGVKWFCIFTRKNDLLSWFGYVRVNYHFPFGNPFQFFFRSSFNKFADSDKSYTVENNEVSSANNLAYDSKFSGGSLMYIKKTVVLILTLEEHRLVLFPIWNVGH